MSGYFQNDLVYQGAAIGRAIGLKYARRTAEYISKRYGFSADYTDVVLKSVESTIMPIETYGDDNFIFENLLILNDTSVPELWADGCELAIKEVRETLEAAAHNIASIFGQSFSDNEFKREVRDYFNGCFSSSTSGLVPHPDELTEEKFVLEDDTIICRRDSLQLPLPAEWEAIGPAMSGRTVEAEHMEKIRPYLGRAIAAGLVTDTGNGYRWNGTNALCAYFAEKCNEVLPLSKSRCFINWRPFCSLFGLTMKQLQTGKNVYKSQGVDSPLGSEKVDLLFSD